MKSKYEHFSELIRRQIVSGVYGDNGFLPGERVLSEQFGISRVCVRMGLELLKNSRMIESVPGKGHMANLSGKGGKKALTGFVAVIFAGVEMQWPSSEMLEGILLELEDSGFKLVLSSSSLDLTVQRLKFNDMLSRKVDGIIAVPLYRKKSATEYLPKSGNLKNLKSIQDSGVPLVLIDRPFKPEGLFPCVCNDDFAGGFIAAEHLLKKGHREIVFLATASDYICELRDRGYSAAMGNYGEKALPCLIKGFDGHGLRYDNPAFVHALKEGLSKHGGYTALVTMGMLPYSFAETFAELHPGKDLPEIIGYDRGPAPGSRLHYSWIKRPMEEIGRRGARKLISLIRGEKVELAEHVKPVIVESGKTTMGT